MSLNYEISENVKNLSRLIYGNNTNAEQHRIYDPESPRTGVREVRTEDSYALRNQTLIRNDKIEHDIILDLIFIQKNFEVFNRSITNEQNFLN